MINYLLGPGGPDFVGFFFTLIVLVLALSLHEFGHAAAAELQGDHTAKLAGRLTLNPLSHLDVAGSILIVLAGFGWGKPVPFTPSQLRSRRFGSAIVALAGPVTNILLAVLAAFFLVRMQQPALFGPTGGNLYRFLLIAFELNVVLAVFNLIPIPPLDGSRILGAVLPPSKQHIIFFLDRYGILILFVGIYLFRGALNPVVSAVAGLLVRLVGG